jgi:orotidine-5'-phosphate decarboxylase
MLEAAVREGGSAVAAVTVLSSFSEDEVQNLYGVASQEAVKELATCARNAGVTNIVCSPHEISIVKTIDHSLSVITPGIRPSVQPPEVAQDDQSRVMTPREAQEAGADFLVIGRPITKALDPQRALEEILQTLL